MEANVESAWYAANPDNSLKILSCDVLSYQTIWSICTSLFVGRNRFIWLSNSIIFWGLEIQPSFDCSAVRTLSLALQRSGEDFIYTGETKGAHIQFPVSEFPVSSTFPGVPSVPHSGESRTHRDFWHPGTEYEPSVKWKVGCSARNCGRRTHNRVDFSQEGCERMNMN